MLEERKKERKKERKNFIARKIDINNGLSSIQSFLDLERKQDLSGANP